MSAPSPSPDAATLFDAPRKGRGTMWALEHRFSSSRRETFDDGWGTVEQAAREELSLVHI